MYLSRQPNENEPSTQNSEKSIGRIKKRQNGNTVKKKRKKKKCYQGHFYALVHWQRTVFYSFICTMGLF